MEVLSQLGNVPFTLPVVASLYPGVSAVSKKLSKLEDDGALLRLKRGLYVVSSEISGRPLSSGLISNDIYSPSYISCHTALRYYGLIPETVFTIQAMTVKHSRTFVNDVGRFEYTHISRDIFPIGLTRMSEGGVKFIIATPEKALCDLIATTSGLTLRYKSEAVRYLEEDLRLDMDCLDGMDTDILERYIEAGKKAGSIRTILKLIR